MNKALTSDRKIMDHCRPIALANYKLLTIALVAAGYESTRFKVLEPSCDFSLPELEERKEEWVELYLNALGLGVDLTTFPDVNSCENISSQSIALAVSTATYASLSTNLTGDDNDIVWTSRTVGALGNLIQIAYIDPADNNQALSVTVVGTLIRVSLATGVAGAITSTASQVYLAVFGNANANALVSGVFKTGNTGGGIVTAMAATNLSGGHN